MRDVRDRSRAGCRVTVDRSFVLIPSRPSVLYIGLVFYIAHVFAAAAAAAEAVTNGGRHGAATRTEFHQCHTPRDKGRRRGDKAACARAYYIRTGRAANIRRPRGRGRVTPFGELCPSTR